MRWGRIPGLVLAMLAVSAAPAGADLTPLPGAPVVDGPVTTMVQAGGRVFIGGAFQSVGPRTGPLVRVDATTGTLARGGAPFIAQGIGETAVRAIAPDGAGGFYVAGNFSVVDGVGRPALVHLRADGTVAPEFMPPAFASAAGAPEIRALVVGGGRIYAGGRFTSVGGVPRMSLVALDARTGALLPGFDGRLAGAAPAAVPEVEDLALAGSALYVGGSFAAAGGASEPGLVALGATTGSRLAAFDADLASSAGLVMVQDLLLSGGALYAVGAFTAAGGRPAQGLAALQAANGRALEAFQPPAFTPAMGATFALTALARLGEALYVGGPFTAVGGRRRTGLAALHAATGAPLDGFAPPTLRAGPAAPAPVISALTVRRSTLLVGGRFVVADTVPPDANLIGVDGVTGALRGTFNPRINGEVEAVAPTTTGLLVGGRFTSANTAPRAGLAALSARSADLDEGFVADVRGTVDALAVARGRLFVGGAFDRVQGVPRRNLAAVSTTSGRPLSGFRPEPNGRVTALAARGTRLYVGGRFTRVGGVRRRALALLSALSGRGARGFDAGVRALPFVPPVSALLATSSALYVGGSFTRIGGAPRVGLAALGPGTGRALRGFEADVNPGGSVLALALGRGRLYVGGAIRSINGTRELRLGAVSPRTGAVAAGFRGSTPGAVDALVVHGSRLYQGGPAAALTVADARTGAVNGATRIVPPYAGGVHALVAIGRNLFVGGPDGERFVVYRG